MTERVAELKKQLAAVESAISETEARLPAHSVKPPVMHDLLALEDERDSLLAEIHRLQSLDKQSG
jgi:hypothetical protein